jgi:hypothetical protein
MAYVVGTISPIERVFVYTNPSVSESLSSLTDESIIPVFIYLTMLFGGISMEQLSAEFRELGFDFMEQPDAERTDPNYDKLDPFTFAYLVTAIPRNHTDAFMNYQRNKSKGLVRQADVAGLLLLEDDSIINVEALRYAADFFKRHHRLYSRALTILLGMANPLLPNPATDFAVQMLTSVEYGNMVGVKIIEETLIQPNHPIMTDIQVQGYLRYYLTFKRNAKRAHGNRDWIYTALLDRARWLNYSKNDHFIQLWIFAAAIAYSDHRSYGTMMIKRHSVQAYSVQDKYKNKIRDYQLTQRVQVSTSTHSGGDLAEIRARVFAQYGREDDDE